MKRVVIVTLMSIAALPAFAAAPRIEAAIKVFRAVSADPARLKTFCAMDKVMVAAGDKPTPAAEAQIEGYMKQLGAEFETAWNAAEGLNENSADMKAFNAALSALEGKCP